MKALLLVLASLLFINAAKAQNLQCCVYTDEQGECSELCPAVCKGPFDECPYMDGCFVQSVYSTQNCLEPGNCFCPGIGGFAKRDVDTVSHFVHKPPPVQPNCSKHKKSHYLQTMCKLR